MESGKCVTLSAVPRPTDSLPLSVPVDPSATDQVAGALRAESSFVTYVGLPTCTGTMPASVPITPQPSQPTATTSVGSQLIVTVTNSALQLLTSSLSARQTSTPSTSSTPKNSDLDTGAKIGIGIGVPLGIATLILLSFLLWRRYRNRKRKVSAQKTTLGDDSENPSMAYLQQKAELDAEQRRFEMAVNEIQCEMSSGVESHELSGHDSRIMQELKGTDHSQELEVSVR